MFKELGNFASLLKSAQEMGGKFREINDGLRNQRVSGQAGGGMVTVEANGVGEVLSVKIDSTLVAQGELDMIEDLVPAAVNQAMTKANELRAAALQDLTGGLSLPGLEDAIGKMMGNGS